MTIKELSEILLHIDPTKEIKLRIGTYEDFGEEGYDKVYSEYTFDKDDLYLNDTNDLIIEP